ncbi:MAG: TonB-dependent receptor [Candidatus Andeanibacterium colombiense]|uniref:TonB-dependent receptor n=1 Tax=Candidatus Andeanibacterium colombiense TaxID=3121345 RepID=A0AAJ5X5K9_9SPHN|nr:MAG: TonB-dependent receptor [Sphingomonadaceae bacterium]
MKPIFLTCVSMLSIAFGAGAALADTPEAAGSADSDDIVVTAQKRSEPLSKVPVQITVLTAQSLEQRDIKSTLDVFNQSPNMTVDAANTYRDTFITMRGMAQIQNADPPVAYVVDGVAVNNAESIDANLLDVERIEVLRGPQGSLYGRNAVGGAINVVTKAPTNDFEGSAQASYGNGDAVRLAAAISGPIIDDKILFRTSASFYRTDGLLANGYRGDLSDYVHHDYTLRQRLLITPVERLTIDLRADYNNFDAGNQYYSLIPSGQTDDFPGRIANLPGNASGHSTNLSAKLDYDLGPATLTSITGYNNLYQLARADSDFRNDVDYPDGLFGTGMQFGQSADLKLRTFSQELRLTSTGDGPVRWLAGAYYLDTRRTFLGITFLDTDGTTAQADDPAKQFWVISTINAAKAYALFGQVDVDLAEGLTLTGGLRQDWNDRTQTNLDGGLVRKLSFAKLQPKATLSYTLAPGKLLYLTYSTGFRAGGLNDPGIDPEDFKAETLQNYEAGFRMRFSDALSLSGAYFHTEVHNYQSYRVDGFTGAYVVFGIPNVRINGIELSTTAVPFAGLTLDGGIGTALTRISDSPDADTNGKRTPRTVPFSSTLGATYEVPVGGSAKFVAHADWKHFGKKYWDPDNASVQAPYDLVSARAGVQLGDLGIFAFGKNLLNEQYYTDFFQPKYSGFDYPIGLEGQPRTYGIEASYKF